MSPQRSSSRLSRACVLATASLLAACQTTNVKPFQPGNANAQLEQDETRLWARSAEEQDLINRSGILARIPAAEEYLNSIVRRLHPAPLPNGTVLRVKIITDPSLNAMAFPNGLIYVHTGMLVRLENEAQIATVLAHELTHSTHRHGLRDKRHTENTIGVLATLHTMTYGVSTLLGAIGARSAVAGYSQDLEREADKVGFQLLLQAGYDPREAPKVFQHLQAEAKRSKAKEPYFFGSHPRLAERIENFETFLRELPVEKRSGQLGADTYLTHRHLLLELNARAALTASDHDFALECTEQFLQREPGQADLLHLKAEILRRRATNDDLAKATEIIRALTTSQPDYAEAHRTLGLLEQKQNRPAQAHAAYTRYLQLKPDAPDRAYIETFIQQCATPSNTSP